MSAITTAYIGLGSNLDDPVNQVHSALSELSRLPDTQSVAQSRLYRSAPVGPCLLYTSPSPRDKRQSRMPSSA